MNRRLRIAHAILAAEQGPQVDAPTQAKLEELVETPKSTVVQWLHNWIISKSVKAVKSFATTYSDFFQTVVDGPRMLAKMGAKLPTGQWTEKDTSDLISAVADFFKIPVALVYFGLIPLPPPLNLLKIWSYWTPLRVQKIKEELRQNPKTERFKLERTLLPSRFINRDPAPSEEGATTFQKVKDWAKGDTKRITRREGSSVQRVKGLEYSQVGVHGRSGKARSRTRLDAN